MKPGRRCELNTGKRKDIGASLKPEKKEWSSPSQLKTPNTLLGGKKNVNGGRGLKIAKKRGGGRVVHR